MLEQNPIALMNKAKETFIKARTLEEQKFNSALSVIKRLPKEVLSDKLSFNIDEITIQSLVPEWYVEKPNSVICEQQVAAANEKLEEINKINSDLNQESLKALEEYNKLYGG